MDKQPEKRTFPRTSTQCPVLYKTDNDKRWMVGILLNMSATGMQMKTKQPVSEGIKIDIQYKPGKNKLVPEITASGTVTRVAESVDGQYQVACKLVNVRY
jgi:hypothetical protein